MTWAHDGSTWTTIDGAGDGMAGSTPLPLAAVRAQELWGPVRSQRLGISPYVNHSHVVREAFAHEPEERHAILLGRHRRMLLRPVRTSEGVVKMPPSPSLPASHGERNRQRDVRLSRIAGWAVRGGQQLPSDLVLVGEPHDLQIYPLEAVLVDHGHRLLLTRIGG